MFEQLNLIDQAYAAADEIIDSSSCHKKAREDVRIVMDRLIDNLNREDKWSWLIGKATRMEKAS